MSEGKIVRRLQRWERSFTQVPNHFARDTKLTLKARGLLTLLLSLKDGEKVSVADLVKDGHGKRDYIAAGVDELEQHGYLARRPHPRRGRFAGYDWELTEPLDMLAERLEAGVDRYGITGTGNPTRSITDTENPYRTDTENPEPNKNTKNTNNSLPSVSTGVAAAPVDNSAAASAPRASACTVKGHRPHPTDPGTCVRCWNPIPTKASA